MMEERETDLRFLTPIRERPRRWLWGRRPTRRRKRKKKLHRLCLASVLAGGLSAHSDGQSLSKQNASFKTIERITTGEQKKARRTQISGATIGPTRARGEGPAMPGSQGQDTQNSSRVDFV